jgi:hypothetical protein
MYNMRAIQMHRPLKNCRGGSATLHNVQLIRSHDGSPQYSRKDIISGLLISLIGLFVQNSQAENGGISGKAGETVLLIGASGAIGQYVTRDLKKRGCKVRGLTRFPKEAKEQLGDYVDWIGGDLLKPETLEDKNFFRNLVAGVDRVRFPHSQKRRNPELQMSSLF